MISLTYLLPSPRCVTSSIPPRRLFLHGFDVEDHQTRLFVNRAGLPLTKALRSRPLASPTNGDEAISSDIPAFDLVDDASGPNASGDRPEKSDSQNAVRHWCRSRLETGPKGRSKIGPL